MASRRAGLRRVHVYHSVNVCIFSVALGRKLGLTKLQSTIWHGRPIPRRGQVACAARGTEQAGRLSDEEWRIMQAHRGSAC